MNANLVGRNLDWRLGRYLTAHDVESVPLLGWAGIQNGELLKKAVDEGFEILVTMDSNMVHQQNIGSYAIALIALRAKSNRLEATRPLMAPMLRHLQSAKPATVTFVPAQISRAGD